MKKLIRESLVENSEKVNISDVSDSKLYSELDIKKQSLKVYWCGKKDQNKQWVGYMLK